MFPLDSQSGGQFGPPGGSFGGNFGSQPPQDDIFGQSSIGGGFDFDEGDLSSFFNRKTTDVIGIGLHFHEKLRKMK
ncbi:MAG: hypothetical protein V1738_05170 [Patescibacteria group bacterium]